MRPYSVSSSWADEGGGCSCPPLVRPPAPLLPFSQLSWHTPGVPGAGREEGCGVHGSPASAAATGWQIAHGVGKQEWVGAELGACLRGRLSPALLLLSGCCRPFAEKYAADQGAFFKDYVESHLKLSELGVA